MRVFVAGATGALGVPVVRLLVADGHEVVALTRSPSRASIVAKLGARPVIGNALDPESINAAVLSSAPDAVIHALTAIPKRGPLRASDLKATNKLRVVGTRHLLDAAIRAGARRIVVESMAFIYGYGDLGSKPLTEDTPPPTTAPQSWLLLHFGHLPRKKLKSWKRTEQPESKELRCVSEDFTGRVRAQRL